MKFRIVVNRNDCKGWRLWDDNWDITNGYNSFGAATGNKSELARNHPEWNFKVIGIEV